jgi:hypothetical protein
MTGRIETTYPCCTACQQAGRDLPHQQAIYHAREAIRLARIGRVLAIVAMVLAVASVVIQLAS